MSRLAVFALVLLALLASGPLRADEPAEIAAIRAKAEKGNGLAQYNLGLVYATGDGVAADLPEAFVWLTLASENGATGRAMDRVLGNITDAQLIEGRRRLADFRAALANKAAILARPAARRTANRGFSLTAFPSVDPGINPEPDALVTHPPGSSVLAEPVRSSAPTLSTAPAPATDEPEPLKAEIVRLKAELARANQKVQTQAATIVKLQSQLAAQGAPSPALRPDPPRTTPPDGVAPRPPSR